MLKIAILDDDKTALSISKGAVEQFLQDHNVAFSLDAFYSANAFVISAKSEKYQLVLLDIDMEEMSGIDVGKVIKENNPQADVIFLSQREDLVFDTLFLHPFGFIRKSKLLQDFPSVMELYLETHSDSNNPNHQLVVTSKSGVVNINIEEIMYIEGNKNYQTIYLKNGTSFDVRLSMGELEEKLSNKGFIRIHKGYLVNYLFIRKIVKVDVLLTNNKILPLAGKRKEEIMEKYLAVSRTNKSIFL